MEYFIVANLGWQKLVIVLPLIMKNFFSSGFRVITKYMINLKKKPTVIAAESQCESHDSIIDPNGALKKYLNYYLNFQGMPGYAVMLKGPWGIGKSWFVEQFFKERHNEKQQVVRISLCDITTFDQMEFEIFRQLHPVLGSKLSVLGGKMVKATLKAGLKIDFSDYHSSSNVSHPEADLPDFLKKANEKTILVFDDLERSTLPIVSVLGYINSFVDKGGNKVLIIANESEIEGSTVSDEEVTPRVSDYYRMKEKVIGKTFEIAPDFHGAIRNFISELNNPLVSDAYAHNASHIESIFDNSEYKNLRHFRQALLDFDRFLEVLEKKYKTNHELVLHILTLMIIYSCEIRECTLATSKIDPSKLATIRGKYPFNNKFQELFEVYIWEQFFDKGVLESELINEAISNSKYFFNESTPAWVKLWHVNDLSDSLFELLLKEVDEVFFSCKLQSIGDVQHVAGMFFFFKKESLHFRNNADVLSKAKEHIDLLIKEKPGEIESLDLNSYDFGKSWAGLGFYDLNSSEMNALCDYVKAHKLDAIKTGYPAKAKQLLSEMVSDTGSFVGRLHSSNQFFGSYVDYPILCYVPIEEFVARFLELQPKNQRQVAYLFKWRYEGSTNNQKLIKEADWLENVIKLILEEKNNRNGKLSAFQLKTYLDEYFMPALRTLRGSD